MKIQTHYEPVFRLRFLLGGCADLCSAVLPKVLKLATLIMEISDNTSIISL